MSALIKFKFLLILLLLSQQVFGVDRYFAWINPQTKLRNRINPDTQELFSEQLNGTWKNEGKINVDSEIFNRLPPSINNNYFNYGNKIRFVISGTGQVYDYIPLKKALIRVDQTFHSGFNFGANQFSRKGVIYSIGGEGFWSYSNSITFFDEKLKEWEIIRPKNNGPLPITDGYQGYHAEKDVFYSGASFHNNYLETDESSFQENLYLFDFKTNKWEFLGKLNNELPYKKSPDIIWTGKLFLHFFNKSLYIIDPLKNEVFFYKDKQRDLSKGYDSTIYQDTLILFKGPNGGPILKLSVSEIQKNAILVGKFYNSGIEW